MGHGLRAIAGGWVFPGWGASRPGAVPAGVSTRSSPRGWRAGSGAGVLDEVDVATAAWVEWYNPGAMSRRSWSGRPPSKQICPRAGVIRNVEGGKGC